MMPGTEEKDLLKKVLFILSIFPAAVIAAIATIYETIYEAIQGTTNE